MTTNNSQDMNRDPISGAPGAHPVGTGLGAAGGATAGAAIGAVGGPVGMVVGGAIGAVVGGLGGKAVGEAVNPTAEDAHWRSNYANESYVKPGHGYEDYSPAYQLGYSNRAQYQGKSFEQAETSLASDWERTKGQSRLAWQDAKPAAQAAWHRVERALPGDADGDGL